MAGPRCLVCDHAKRAAIETDLAVCSTRDIAGRYDLSKSSVQRHKASHLMPLAARALASRDELSGDRVIDQMVELQSKTWALLTRAESEGSKPAEQARIIREARENLIALARLIGLLREGTTTINDNRSQTALVGMTTEELRTYLDAHMPAPPKVICTVENT